MMFPQPTAGEREASGRWHLEVQVQDLQQDETSTGPGVKHGSNWHVYLLKYGT